jgi:GNAT superfamily N-acetyltransferase
VAANEPTLELRVESADTEASRALQHAFFAEIAGLYPGFDPALAPSAEPDEVTPPEGAWIVAYLGDRAVGCGCFKRLDDTTAEVKRLYLEPAARGRGVGRRLLEALEEQARLAGYSRVRLDTGPRQPVALALFRAAGYRDIEDYNRNPFAGHWLEKRL